MKLLLDTHIFLWLIDDNKRLSAKLRQEIRNPNNERFLSVASIWECVIKYQLRKIAFPHSPEIYLPEQVVHSYLNFITLINSEEVIFNSPSMFLTV
jgi:PIN domain nuclease of toxin-antitoxin system